MEYDAFLIGAGRAARNHANALLRCPSITLRGCFDIDSSLARELATDFDIERYETLEEVLHSKRTTSVVIICTPPATHIDLALKAIERGFHVLVEKPFCFNSEDIDLVVSKARKYERLIGAVAQHRYSPGLQQVRAFLEEIGTKSIDSIELEIQRNRPIGFFSTTNNWRMTKMESGGGVLITIGFHYLDILCSIFQDIQLISVEVIAASGAIEHDISVNLAVDGISCSVTAKWGDFLNQRDQIVFHLPHGKQTFTRGHFDWPEHTNSAVEKVELLANQLNDFAESLANGGKGSISPLSVKKTIGLINQIYKTADL